jgi:hypothetical protein
MLELIRNILKFLRHHSYHEFLDRMWRAAVRPLYESATHYIVKLDLKSAVAPNPNRDIKELTTADINKMLEVMYVSCAGLQERFSRGDRCFAVLDNDKIVSYFWAQFGLRDVYELRLKFNLPPNQAWMYNAVTVKIARGRGLYPDLIRYMAKALLQSGINESFIDVDSRNRSSIRGLEKAGCTRVILINMKRIFASVSYKLTVFDKETWQQLSLKVEDFHHLQNVTEDSACL